METWSWIGRAALVLCLAALPSCRQRTVDAAPDALLGKWVLIGDNVHAHPDGLLDFKADGTVVATSEGRTWKMAYRRSAAKQWLRQRGLITGPVEWTGPGFEIIDFPAVRGPSSLILDPEHRILHNYITQTWCRPGDQARVKADSKLGRIFDENLRPGTRSPHSWR
jgi:hypothetical protein